MNDLDPISGAERKSLSAFGGHVAQAHFAARRRSAVSPSSPLPRPRVEAQSRAVAPRRPVAASARSPTPACRATSRLTVWRPRSFRSRRRLSPTVTSAAGSVSAGRTRARAASREWIQVGFAAFSGPRHAEPAVLRGDGRRREPEVRRARLERPDRRHAPRRRPRDGGQEVVVARLGRPQAGQPADPPAGKSRCVVPAGRRRELERRHRRLQRLRLPLQ